MQVVLNRIKTPHRCSICGKWFTWNEGKTFWHGSYRDIDDGLPVVKLCSEKCLRSFELCPERTDLQKQEFKPIQLS